MATNREHAAINNLSVPASVLSGPNDPVESGDPVLFGDLEIPAVALTDEDSDGNVTVELADCAPTYRLPVHGYAAAANAAVGIGDIVYHDGSEMNVDATNGSVYGTALDAVSSGATTTIRVRLAATRPAA